MEQNKQVDNFELIARYFSGNLSEHEKISLSEWTNKSIANKNQFLEAQRIWELTESKKNEHTFDSEAAWKKLKPKFIESANTKEAEKIIPINKNYWSAYYKIAAILTLILGAVVLLWKAKENSQVETVAFNTTSEKRTIYLPDSTKIYLNKNSTFSYNKEFLKERKVYLSGEAFFEVRKYEGKEFVIETPIAITTVLGTSFNIKTEVEKGEEDIKVFTGKVSYQKIDASESKIFLTKGMEAHASKKGSISLDTFSTTSAIAWKESQLIFDNDNIGKIIEMMNNHFDVDITTKDPHLLSCKFTGRFEKPEIKEMLHVLSLSLNVTYTFTGNKYILSGHGCD